MTFTDLDQGHGWSLARPWKSARRTNYHVPLDGVHLSAGSRWRFVPSANGRRDGPWPVMRDLLTSWQHEQFAVLPWVVSCCSA
jgi:hypothetical protein